MRISFVIHTISGFHLGSQQCVVSINEQTFNIKSRKHDKKKHHYESGFTIYSSSSNGKFSVGIVTPLEKNQYILNAYCTYNYSASLTPEIVNLEMHTVGSQYKIKCSLFISPTLNQDHLIRKRAPSKQKPTSLIPNDKSFQTEIIEFE